MPTISQNTGPKYRAIADSIIDAIETGELSAGTKLPPQRNLAYDLGVTLGTVTRAYQEVERAGYAKGEVGRGTYVLSDNDRGQRDGPPPAYEWWLSENNAYTPSKRDINEFYSQFNPSKNGFELAPNYPLLMDTGHVIASSLKRAAQPELMNAIMGYQAGSGLRPHREAGVYWMKQFGTNATVDQILITPGAQAATQTSLVALTRPGDTILCEELTWPGLKAAAQPLGLTIIGIKMDTFGMVPDAFEQACKERKPKAAYILPTLHNPTAQVMPEDRRRQLAAIALRHGVYIIEDNIYGFLVDDAPPVFTDFMGDHGIYITALSKAVAPGLRIGYVRVPVSLMPRFIGAMRTHVLMASALTAEVAADVIRSGAAMNAAVKQRQEIQIRQQLVTKHLGNFTISRHPNSYHCWMQVPDGVTENEFRNRLLERGVSVAAGNVFLTDDAPRLNPARVRICLGAEADRDRLETALSITAQAMQQDVDFNLPII